MSRYREGYLPGGHRYFFSLKVEPNDKMSIECRVIHTAQIVFKVDVCPFNYEPNIQEILNGNSACAYNLQASPSSDGTYDKYSFPFSTAENVNYITVCLINQQSLDYLDVYIYSEKGMAAYIWVLIICSPCIIIALIVYFVCRQFGCIRVTSDSVSSGGAQYI